MDTNAKDLELRHEILVVDDSVSSLHYLARILTEQGYHVRPATGGLLALRSVEAKLPDLIMLDVRMPDMDGYEVCRRLKADELFRDIPVLFVTSLNENDEKIRAFEAGAVDYITKPYLPEEVLARVKVHVRMRSLAVNLEKTVQLRTEELSVVNLQLRQLLEEKTVMLKEIHHRVKNNMQVITSLLNLQAKESDDPAVRALFDESRNRIQSMALVHERLYRAADLAHIDFKEYLESLVRDLSQGISRPGVTLSVDMASVSLDVSAAVPCGLIVNELVSNSLKYAFPDGRKGTIRAGIKKHPGGSSVLFVADDGAGFPGNLDFRNTGSLGLRLVNVLAGQLHGTIEMLQDGGTEFRITFPGK